MSSRQLDVVIPGELQALGPLYTWFVSFPFSSGTKTMIGVTIAVNTVKHLLYGTSSSGNTSRLMRQVFSMLEVAEGKAHTVQLLMHFYFLLLSRDIETSDHIIWYKKLCEQGSISL